MLTKYRIHILGTESASACIGQSANILIENTILSGSNNRRYELRNPDGTLNGTTVSGEIANTTLESGPIVSDTTLVVYALSDVGDGSVLEEFIGEVSITAGDDLLNQAQQSEISFDEQLCYNERGKIVIVKSELGVSYSLLDIDNNVLISKPGTGKRLVLRTNKLKESITLGLRMENIETGCYILFGTPISIEVDEKIIAKLSFDRRGVKLDEPTSFSILDDDSIVSWEWTFDKKTELSGSNVSHTFKRPGIHWIKLVVTNENGCSKEIQRKILIKRKIFFGVPAVFWPCTAQGIFKAKLKHTKKEQLVIVNGRGKVIHAGMNEWHGIDKRGRLVPAGRYYYRINAMTVDGEPFQKRGSFYVSY